MYRMDFIRVLAIAFAALFPVVNPIGDAPIFLSLTRRYSPAAQRSWHGEVAFYGFIFAGGVISYSGSEILSFFGVTLVLSRSRVG